MISEKAGEEGAPVILPHYAIGDSLGGSQDWFADRWMHIGGCAAVTACELCAYLARYRGYENLCPFDPAAAAREDFLAFGMTMKPYLRPRPSGVNKTEIFLEGFGAYLRDRGETGLSLSALSGVTDGPAAREALRERLDAGMPVPALTLMHRDREFADFCWHWYLINGYEDTPEGFFVTAVTYGESHRLDFARLWDTGRMPRGGLVLCREKRDEKPLGPSGRDEHV